VIKYIAYFYIANEIKLMLLTWHKNCYNILKIISWERMSFMAVSVEQRRKSLFEEYRVWPIESIGHHFKTMAEKYRTQPFIITETQSYTYQDVWDEGRKYAKSLLAQGIKPEDHVAVLISNRPESVFLMLGIWMVGAVCVPVNTMLREQELLYLLKQSDTRWLFLEQFAGGVMHADSVSNIYKELAANKDSHSLKKIFCIKNTDNPLDNLFQPWETFFELSVSDDILDEALAKTNDPHILADIMYTSGSTGFPKGVTITHDMILRSGYSTAISRAYEDGRRIYTALPLYHIFALAEGLMAVSFVGGALILDNQFKPLSALEMIEKHRANDILCVPSMLVSLINQTELKPFNFDALHSIMCAATAAPISVWERAKKVFNIKEICTGYGSTEVTGAVVHTEQGDAVETVSTRVGRLKPSNPSGVPELGFANIHIKTVDPDTGEDLPEGSVGEITIKGNLVTKGYYKMPEETSAVVKNDGWFRTGDLGRIDEHGYIELLGRSKEMYKVSGENVAPKEIEDVISKHESVNQAYVVGVKDAVTFETGAAFVELRPGAACTRRELLTFCQNHLARFKVPRYIWFITADELPITGNGKIQKFALAEIAEHKLAQMRRSRGNLPEENSNDQSAI